MPSDEAQKIMNRGVSNDPTKAARLISEATDEVLSEVLAGAPLYGSPLYGVVRVVQAEIQRRAVDAQIDVTEKLDRGNRRLVLMGIAVAGVGVLVVIMIWLADRFWPATPVG